MRAAQGGPWKSFYVAAVSKAESEGQKCASMKNGIISEIEARLGTTHGQEKPG